MYKIHVRLDMNEFKKNVRFDLWLLKIKYLTYNKLELISEELGVRKLFQGRN